MKLRTTCPVCGGEKLLWGDPYDYYGRTYHPYRCETCKTEGAEYEQPAYVDPYEIETEFIDAIAEKIREAEQCEDPDVDQKYLTGYINGLNMAITIMKEHGLCSKQMFE